MIIIRWWNKLRNRPLITDLQRQVNSLEQIIQVMERQQTGAQRDE